ncbi:hypothetical protein OH76DRAFT_1502747 [Lentinus brumalis]|uniref:DUF4100 domain-containing protein n=1 Tax=Lentinus brumalis TaxID=2498619 RepID=A0A371CLQ7_9APHY|nr:hypothetical protein OH76DRAFT_1502747 [Polyporus brumalis]
MSSNTTHTMPIPGMSDAPKFDGHYLSDFLEDLELHFARAGVTDEDRQVNYITRYSTDKIRKQIGSLPELDRSKTNKTWSEAKAVLKEFYGDVDKPRPLSLAEFQAWVQSCADKPAFVSKDQVNKYYAEFMSKGRPLLDNKQVSENDLNFAFIQGVPSAMKAALRGLIPEANRTRTSPSPIKKTLEYLRGLANKDDPTYESWRYEHIAAEDTLVPALPEDQDASTTPRTIQNTAAGGRPAAKSSAVADDQMDSLLKQFAELKIMMAQMQPGQQNQQNRPQRCAMCSTPNPNHTMRTCPESLRLVAEGRIQLDAVKNRYVLTSDGSELPRIPYGYEGGIAAYLRAQMPIPPTTHATHSAGLVFENGAVFSTLTNPPNAYPALRGGKEYENRFDPRKRPSDNPSARQRTAPDAPDAAAPSQQPILPPRPAAPPPSDPRPVPSTSAPPPSIPEPQHAINRKDGWKQSQPKAKGKETQHDEDIVMRDGSPQNKAKHPAPASGYKHITDLESQTSSKDVFYKLLQDVSVTLPLGQVLGTSSALQDLIHEATRRRRVPKDAVAHAHAVSDDTDELDIPAFTSTHAAAASLDASSLGVTNTYAVHVSHLDASGIPIVEAEYATGSSNGDYVLIHDGTEVSQQQLAFSTFPISRTKAIASINDRMFAMATGVFTVKVNGVSFRVMVDSGSELNVARRSFPDVTRLPLDSLGSYWQLKGIHGSAEKLAGYVDRVPFQIGRHTFEHHVFVSPHDSIGDSFDIILGQPFLTYFDARVEYSATGETVLYLWADRDKEYGQRPTLGISITDPEDVRNKKEIVARLHAAALQQAAAAAVPAPAPSATVEEVEDEGYYGTDTESGF